MSEKTTVGYKDKEGGPFRPVIFSGKYIIVGDAEYARPEDAEDAAEKVQAAIIKGMGEISIREDA